MPQKTIYELEGVVSLEDKNLAAKAKRVLKNIRGITAGFETMARADAGLIKLSSKGKLLAKAVEEADKRVEALAEALHELEDIGAPDEDIREVTEELERAKREADSLAEGFVTMKKYGKGGLFEESGPPSFIADMQAYAAKAKSIVGGTLSGTFSDLFGQAVKGTPFGRFLVGLKNVRDKISDTGYLVKHYAKGMWNDLKTAGGKIVGACKRIGAGFKRITAGSQGATAGVRGLARRMVGLAAAFFGAHVAINATKEGMNNLIAYDSRTANSVSMLKSSLDTLKNALATAFAPILNAVAPMLNTLINMLVRAATAVAHFTAAITGQKSVVVAKKATSGYTSAVGDAAKGSKKASKAAKEYQRTLMGFDQINKLEEKDKSGSGAGGAGGGAGGVGGLGSMFDTVPIDSKISAFADKIKEAWKKGDFTEIGAILANKINAAMEAIPWTKINNTAKKIARSIGTFINGFVETFNWKLLGKTISNGIIVAMNFLSTLLETIHWQSIGKAIVDFISGIRWGALFKGASRLAGNLLGALAGVLAGVAKALGKRVKKYFQKAMKDAGGSVIKGLLLGIVRAIKGIARWIKNNIFKPFIDGFKKAFGISSPSKVMKEQGGYMISGMLEGLKDNLGDILDWFAGLPGKIKEAIGDIVINVVGKIGEGLDWLSETTPVKTVEVGLQKARTWAADAWTAVSSIGKTGTATLQSAVEKAKKWVDDAWAAATKVKGTVTRTLSQGVEKAKTWTKDAWAAAKKGKGTVARKLAQSVGKGATWTKDAWAAAKKKAETVTRTLKVKVTAAASKAYNAAVKKLRSSGIPLVKSFGNKLPYPLASGGVYKSGKWQPVQTAETGGSFSQGQMFIAREAGPELVGRIGGNTAVMNNDQIVASVAAGVAQAVASVMSSQGDKDVNVYLMGDASGLFRVVRQKANDYTRATGQPAFPV